MSLADRCIHEFDSGVRSRGEQYFREDRVSSARSGGQAISGRSSAASPSTKWSWTGGSAASNWPSAAPAPTMTNMRPASIFGQPSWPPMQANIGPRGKSRLGILPMDPEDYDDDDEDSWIDVYDDG